MKTIIVKLHPLLTPYEEKQYQEELRESINKQRKTGVIILPNYASYEGAIDDRKCDTCEIAKYTNLEDDDTPCQNCEENDDAD